MINKLSKSDIVARVKMGQQFCKRFVQNDRQASQKYRDASSDNYWISDDASEDEEYRRDEGGDVPSEVSIGQSNVLTTNILIKCAGISIGNPDWHVKCNNAENQQIVRMFLREKWRLSNWVRLTQRGLQKRYISGLGTLAYLWDSEEHVTFEFVQSWDLSLDPHTTDFTKLRWAARRIKMPVREAIERYGNKHFNVSADAGTSIDKKKSEVWLYYDQEVEAHILDGEVVEQNDNLYGRVPLLFLEGDIDPTSSIWPLGDSQMAAGLQAEISDLNQIISQSAKHGGVINLVATEQLGKAGMQALENGMEQGFVPVDDLTISPVSRIPAEPLSPTVLEARRQSQVALDAVTGVNQYQRGITGGSGAQFATEVAYANQQSGARGIQSRIEFERFLNRMAEIMIGLEVQFGGAREGMESEEAEILMLLWEALADVQEVQVIENSTAFKDPAQETQNALLTLNTIAQLTPLFQAMPEMPNLRAYVDDFLRASGHQDVSRYWTPNPSLQQPDAQQFETGGTV